MRGKMEDDLSFEFEGGLDAGVCAPATMGAPPGAGGQQGTMFDQGVGSGQSLTLVTQQLHSNKNYRQTVCRHWLRGLCMKGDMCGFLHQFDKSKMPVCRFFAKFGECREVDCPFKHSETDIKDCNMYNLGFCIHGNQCRYRHIKRPGPPPAPEIIADQIQRGTINKNKDQNNFSRGAAGNGAARATNTFNNIGSYSSYGGGGRGGGRGRGRGGGFGGRGADRISMMQQQLQQQQLQQRQQQPPMPPPPQ